jgi:cytoskeletal protein CcmA (bactofilin family)
MPSLLTFARKSYLWWLSAIVLVLLLQVWPVWGNQFQAGETVTIGADIVEKDDVYLAGKTVIIDGTVRGDAVVAGRQIEINGTVEGDVIAAGQSIAINGKVGDDLRMAGEVLKIGENAQVNDDAIAAGFSLETQKNSQIGGNLQFVGAQALLSGTVAQELNSTVGALKLNGTVEKDAKLIVGQEKIQPPTFRPKPALQIPDIPNGLTLTASAKIGGKLSYQSPRAAKVAQGAQVAGGIEYEPLELEEEDTLAEIWLGRLQWLATLILIGWLLIKFAPNWTDKLTTNLQERPLPSLGWGFVSVLAVGLSGVAIFIGTFILIFLLAFTLSNLILPVFSLGLLAYFVLLLGFLLIVSYLSPVIVSLWGGRWLLQKFASHRVPRSFLSLILGLLVLILVTAIPAVGGLLTVAIALLGLGSFWLWGIRKMIAKKDESLA